jgi:hypothetical protein
MPTTTRTLSVPEDVSKGPTHHCPQSQNAKVLYICECNAQGRVQHCCRGTTSQWLQRQLQFWGVLIFQAFQGLECEAVALGQQLLQRHVLHDCYWSLLYVHNPVRASNGNGRFCKTVRFSARAHFRFSGKKPKAEVRGCVPVGRLSRGGEQCLTFDLVFLTDMQGYQRRIQVQ